MNLYLAPMEGLTAYIYRKIHADMFGGCVYYSPFICPTDNERISAKHLKDILPENNEGVPLRVQILANRAEPFLNFTEKIKALGYNEVNINAGCPYPMIEKKGRGSGLLREPVLLERLLNEIFEKSDMKISVKTRIGYDTPDEMEELMEIYNKYPVSLLIIHPRTRVDFYDGVPNMEVFEKSFKKSKNKVCYNGNVFSCEDYKSITEKYPELEGVMIGRGALANPAIFREINGGEKLRKAELYEFSARLAEEYKKVLRSETFTLHKLKALWTYMMWNYPEEKKLGKRIKKANKIKDFLSAVEELPEL